VLERRAGEPARDSTRSGSRGAQWRTAQPVDQPIGGAKCSKRLQGGLVKHQEALERGLTVRYGHNGLTDPAVTDGPQMTELFVSGR
jgi:hypothetical protein